MNAVFRMERIFLHTLLSYSLNYEFPSLGFNILKYLRSTMSDVRESERLEVNLHTTFGYGSKYETRISLVLSGVAFQLECFVCLRFVILVLCIRMDLSWRGCSGLIQVEKVLWRTM
jgi:hypothetical protein